MNIGRIEVASLTVQIMTFILLTVAFVAFFLKLDAANEWLGHIEGQLGIIKVHTNPNKAVILTSYDSAGALRTVRLDTKGRVVVSP